MKLVIDTERVGHAFRRWWWRFWQRLSPIPVERGTCMDCGDELTPNEAHYYGHTCEMCEGIRFHNPENH